MGKEHREPRHGTQCVLDGHIVWLGRFKKDSGRALVADLKTLHRGTTSFDENSSERARQQRPCTALRAKKNCGSSLLACLSFQCAALTELQQFKLVRCCSTWTNFPGPHSQTTRMLLYAPA
jgi:hypothetical protein